MGGPQVLDTKYSIPPRHKDMGLGGVRGKAGDPARLDMVDMQNWGEGSLRSRSLTCPPYVGDNHLLPPLEEEISEGQLSPFLSCLLTLSVPQSPQSSTQSGVQANLAQILCTCESTPIPSCSPQAALMARCTILGPTPLSLHDSLTLPGIFPPYLSLSSRHTALMYLAFVRQNPTG